MSNTKTVQKIATEDAVEALHELGNDDLVTVFANLIHRRTKNLKEVNSLLDQVVNTIIR